MRRQGPAKRCAIYTRKSSEEGLEQSFNSLDAQREACAAYIESQRHEGWGALRAPYDDGGFSGGTLERPALKTLLEDVEAGKVDVVVVYKVDRLTRSLADFAKIVEIFDAAGVSFVSVTQQFNTTSSMGRLTLNVLLSFAQFEREVTGERIRDKIAASKKKGLWMGGVVPLGYDLTERKLIVNPTEAKHVRTIFTRYLALGCVTRLQADLKDKGITSKPRVSKAGHVSGGKPYSRGALYHLLNSRIYRGEITHNGNSYPGQHAAIIDEALWDRVQAKLAENRRARRNGTQAKEPSLLAGILYDAQGHRMTPCHTLRHGKRYRYYVSQALIKQNPKANKSTGRISAYELESAVTERLRSLLSRPTAVLEVLGGEQEDAATQKTLVNQAKTLGEGLSDRPAPEQREVLLSLLRQVVLDERTITLEIRREHLRAILLGKKIPINRSTRSRAPDTQLTRISAEIKISRRSTGARLVMRPDGSDEMPPEPPTTLIRNMAIARAAFEDLLAGKAKHFKEAANRYGVQERQARRIMPLAFLGPDTTENVLKTPTQTDMSFVVANEIRIPILWCEQTVPESQML